MRPTWYNNNNGTDSGGVVEIKMEPPSEGLPSRRHKCES